MQALGKVVKPMSNFSTFQQKNLQHKSRYPTKASQNIPYKGPANHSKSPSISKLLIDQLVKFSVGTYTTYYLFKVNET